MAGSLEHHSVKLYEWYSTGFILLQASKTWQYTQLLKTKLKASVNKAVRNLNLGVMKVEYGESHSDLPVL
jgi:hypothetical protein